MVTGNVPFPSCPGNKVALGQRGPGQPLLCWLEVAAACPVPHPRAWWPLRALSPAAPHTLPAHIISANPAQFEDLNIYTLISPSCYYLLISSLLESSLLYTPGFVPLALALFPYKIVSVCLFPCLQCCNPNCFT